MTVATIIANSQKLKPSDIAAELGTTKFTILEEGKAADFFIENLDENKRRQIADKYQVDIITQNAPKTTIKLLLCDMESTIIDNEFLDEIADYLGIGAKVAEITARAMNGELNFEEALTERIKLVEGLPESEITHLINTRMKYNEGARELIKWCRENGVYTMLVSGGFTAFTKVVAAELGFHEHHANTLLFTEGKLTGVGQPILGKEAKLAFLKSKATELGLSLNQTAAMGDGANDLPMLHAANLSLAYKAKPKVKAEIANQINYTDLAAAKYAFI